MDKHVSAPKIIASVRLIWLDECAVRMMRKKLKLSSESGGSGSEKCIRRYGGAYGGVWRSLFLVSGGRFCVGAFGRNLASVAVKICNCHGEKNISIRSVSVAFLTGQDCLK
jgi:hypothetical protein